MNKNTKQDKNKKQNLLEGRKLTRQVSLKVEVYVTSTSG